MNTSSRFLVCLAGGALVGSALVAQAQDWPQWLGPNRDGKAPAFKAPQTWPKQLTEKWKVAVGQGVSSPALVGDKVYVFTRQDASETVLCLNASDGTEVWKTHNEAKAVTGSAASFGGPRSSPTVTSGKVLTLGVAGTLSCLDAAKGSVLWRKDEFSGAIPRFFASASPLAADGLCIAQLGGPNNGGIVAFDLATGNEKWKWTGDSPAYSSPSLMNVGGTKLIVAMTDTKMVALTLADGKLVWEAPFRVPGMGYNACTPIVDGQTLIYSGSGRGVTAVRIEKEGDGFAGKQLWNTPDGSVQFSTPVVKNGFIYGFSAANQFFCINAQDGKTAWTAPLAPAAAVGGGEAQAGGGMPGRRGGGRAGGGYGSIVDAGSVLLALTPASELVVFQPSEKSFTELARIKVSDSQTHACPVISGNRVLVKDQNSLALLTVD